MLFPKRWNMMEYDGYWWIIGVYGVLFQNFPFCSGLIFQKPKELLHVFFLLASVRWNNHKLKELRDEEDSAMFRQRASRLAKWKELVEDAAKAKSMTLSPPDALESLLWRIISGFFWICLVYSGNFWYSLAILGIIL